jgi:DNA repair protein RecO (recombination protein O)
MPTRSITGIVIGRTNFGEADRVVRLLTAEEGKVSVVAKGVRRIKSRTAGHLELFGEVQLMVASGRGNLGVVTSARLQWYPHELAGDYDRLGLAYACARMIDRFATEHQPQIELYAHLKEVLYMLEAGVSGPLLELWFKLRLLELAGFRPELTQCLVCSRHDSDTEYHFDAARGGIVCTDDAGAIARPMPIAIIKLWRILSDHPYATVRQITGASDHAAASLRDCDEFYEHHLGRSFSASHSFE